MHSSSNIVYFVEISVHFIKNDVQYIGENLKNRWYEFWQKLLMSNMNTMTTYSVYFTYFNLKQTKHYQSNQLAIRYLNKIDWIPVNDFILYILKEKKTF